MAEYAYADFFAVHAADIMETLGRALVKATANGRLDVTERVSAMIAEVGLGLRTIAEATAAVADAAIVTRIAETKGPRPEAEGEHLDQHIASGILPFGTVQVAYIAELDKVVNPQGYGPYWRAQEAGTGSGDPGVGPVPSQAGRVLLGRYGFGEGDRPLAEYTGAGVGTEGQFVSGGGGAGFGTIHTELPARHFLRDGTAEAFDFYVGAMRAFEDKMVAVCEEIQTLTIAGALV